uniref:hypothetical protein n=1 Tax=Acetatifactor sp. TaxID=1872090 RepID=UPI00405635E6
MEGVTTTMMDTIISNASSLIDFGGTLLETVIQHPVLGFFFAAGFIGVGAGVIGTLIGLAHRG